MVSAMTMKTMKMMNSFETIIDVYDMNNVSIRNLIEVKLHAETLIPIIKTLLVLNRRLDEFAEPRNGASESETVCTQLDNFYHKIQRMTNGFTIPLIELMNRNEYYHFMDLFTFIKSHVKYEYFFLDVLEDCFKPVDNLKAV